MCERDNNEHSMVDILRNVEYDLKQNIVINFPPPSLEYLSLSKVAISLWKSHFNAHGSEEARNYDATDPSICNWNPLKSISNLKILKCHEEPLKSLIKSIGCEIENNFLAKKLAAFGKFIVYLENLCFNQQGTFNILETAIKIIDDTNLSALEKYELACDFCLKEKIQNLQKKLFKNDVRVIENKDTFTMATFWSLYIKDENLPILIKGVEARDYLRSCLTEISQNEVALQFIWENFADESWNEQLVHIVPAIFKRKEFSTYNIGLYFFKQMSQDELKEMKVYYHIKVLYKLHAISKLDNLMLVTEYAFDVVKTRNNLRQCFWFIKCCWHIWSFLNVENLTVLWNEFVHHFKPDLEREIVDFYNRYMQEKRFNAFKQLIVVKLIIGYANSEDRKKIIYNRRTMVFCQRLLCEDPRSFDLFVNHILKEKCISHFKKKFFKVRRFTLCAALIIKENYELLEQILVNFCFDETVSEFKEKYCIDILKSVLKEVKKNYFKLYTMKVKLLTVIWKVFSWCLNNNKEEMMRYKVLVFDLNSNFYTDIRKIFFILLKDLIKRGKWNLVRKYLKWILSANQKHITNPMEKLSFAKKIFLAMYVDDFSLSYLKNKNGHGLLRRLLTTCFNEDEVEVVREELLQHNEDLSLLVSELIKCHNIPEVEDILEWSFSSDKNKIADFKIMFVKAFGGSLLFYCCKCYFNINLIKSIIDWFNLSVESAESLKKSFKHFVSNRFYLEDRESDEELTEDQESKRRRLNNHIPTRRICEIMEVLDHYIFVLNYTKMLG